MVFHNTMHAYLLILTCIHYLHFKLPRNRTWTWTWTLRTWLSARRLLVLSMTQC